MIKWECPSLGLSSRWARSKPNSRPDCAIARSDLAEHEYGPTMGPTEPEKLGAQSSWDRPADAETQRPINGQDRSMKPGKPIFTEKKVKPTPFYSIISVSLVQPAVDSLTNPL